MNSSEDKIIDALKRLDTESDEIETLSGVLADMTRAQSFYLRAFPFVGMLAFMGIGIFAAVRFFAAHDIQAWIAYATLFLAALIVMALIKLWLYLVWVRNSLMREIKRMELRCLAAEK
jgi:uncharacterized membrane protein YcjF (UPF0283 family)